MIGRYRYVIRFTGVQAGGKVARRRTTTLHGILADSTPDAINVARTRVARSPKLRGLFYPTYTVASVE
jgi:hypothetical protein